MGGSEAVGQRDGLKDITRLGRWKYMEKDDYTIVVYCS